jgi:rubredoxin
MEIKRRWVRGQFGKLPINNSGITACEIKEWRRAEFAAGRPSGLESFYAAHGVCPECGGEGVRMVDWTAPENDEEREAAHDLNLERLPVYAVCPRCAGTGKT